MEINKEINESDGNYQMAKVKYLTIFSPNY